jgi:hypothetical protein
MKRMLAVLFGAIIVCATFGAVSANADPGPNGENDKGLCTAYFNGQKKGHDKDGDGRTDNENSPFAALENDAEDSGENENLLAEQPVYSDVYEFCQALGIGGQPEHNGRYDCEEPEGDAGRDNDGDLEIECYANDGTAGEDEDGNPYDTGGDHPSGKDR